MQQTARVLLRVRSWFQVRSWLRLGFFAVVVGVLSMLGNSPAAFAQDANLLRDGGFEGTYSSRSRTDLNIPTDWSIWVGETPHTEAWMNLPPVGYPHNGPDPAPHGNARSLNLNKGYATFTAAVYQQVGVPNGSNVSASAYAFLRTCDIPDGSDRCESSPDSNAYTRIGIDPNGGTNPFDSDVVWSSNAAPHESWGQMNVSATATGETVTLFLYATQQWPKELNNLYWDDASLSIGGSGGVAAAAPGAPTPQPTSAAPADAPPVSAQGEQSDGSIVHVVVAGDTMDSIAFAYDVTRADLMTLNNISDPRIIQIGQRIIVRGADPTPEVTSEATAELTEGAVAATSQPPEAVRFAPPAPVISVASGEVAYPIDPENSSASVCVSFFEDANGNRLQDGGESALAGGNVLLTLDGAPAGSHESESLPDPYCFDGLASGNYAVSAAAPSGYGLTTPNQLQVQAYPGAQINVAFGAAEGIEAVVVPSADEGGIVNTTSAAETATSAPNSSGLPDNIGLIVFGAAGVVLVAGMGITLMMRRR
ncbi:MAG: LysM peptidoglycan-binding domain-containing protein [Chloroflexota bacterium]